ncbi:hypothetical protein ACNOYE_06205 [Nannocystaceae bacterium ST9]
MPVVERALQVQFVGGFEGLSLVTIACDSQPAWLLEEIAAILEITSDAALEHLAARWHDHCPSDALIRLEGGVRRELVDKLDRAHVVLARGRKALLLVRMPAIDELVARLDVPAARRLRTHLRERVVPEFHAWERAARALEQPLLSADAVTIAGNRLEFERRCFEAAVLERLLDRLEREGLVESDRLVAFRVVASELALGARLADFAESLAHGWSTPTQIAERWHDTSPLRVGRVIGSLGLKGSRAHSRALLNKARGHDRTVVSHVYSPAAVALIERELRSRGHRRIDPEDALA